MYIESSTQFCKHTFSSSFQVSWSKFTDCVPPRCTYEQKITVILTAEYKSYASDVVHKEKENTLRKIKHKNEPVQTLYQVI